MKEAMGNHEEYAPGDMRPEDFELTDEEQARLDEANIRDENNRRAAAERSSRMPTRLQKKVGNVESSPEPKESPEQSFYSGETEMKLNAETEISSLKLTLSKLTEEIARVQSKLEDLTIQVEVEKERKKLKEVA